MARRRLGFWRRFAVMTIKPVLVVLTKRDWRGMANIPSTGGVIIVANHISEADPLVVAHYINDAGRWPQFLAKSSLFRVPVLGSLLQGTRQIPVYRGTTDAGRALDAAVAAVKAGDAVVVYPEGTTPKQGDLMPRRGKTGAARLWLATGVPVIPVVSWGAQDIFDPRTRKIRVRATNPVIVLAGPPVDLSRWAGAPPSTVVLQEITERLMTTLRGMLVDIAPPGAVEKTAATTVEGDR